MDKKLLKEQVLATIEEQSARIIEIGEAIRNKPELGYKETFTSSYIAATLKEIGFVVEEGLALTGCRAKLDGMVPGPTIAVMGELDAVICREHPEADDDGAVHACGHNIQLAAMVGAAIGLTAARAGDYLAGAIDFMAVPAEEYVELGYRQQLKEQGKIMFFGGKQELVYRGYLDNVDMAIMVHALNLGDKKVMYGTLGNGFVGKSIQFIGKESHAGGAPEKGVNALNAAMLAINNIHAQRETFVDGDKIRVHPIITKGGDIVNVVPADVRLETYVRGRTLQGITDASSKVNRALIAGAMAVGATVKINEIPGYLPLLNCPEMDLVLGENLSELVNEDEVVVGGEFGGSFDFGDLSHLMPTLHPFTGGVVGDLHTREFRISDPETAYVLPAKLLALTLIDLLWQDAARAKEIVAEFKPIMAKEQYLAYQEKMSQEMIAP